MMFWIVITFNLFIIFYLSIALCRKLWLMFIIIIMLDDYYHYFHSLLLFLSHFPSLTLLSTIFQYFFPCTLLLINNNHHYYDNIFIHYRAILFQPPSIGFSLMLTIAITIKRLKWSIIINYNYYQHYHLFSLLSPLHILILLSSTILHLIRFEKYLISTIIIIINLLIYI